MGKEWMKGEALTLIVQRFSGMDYAISYAEHPYLTVRIEGVEVDVVPAFRIPRGQRPITAVDRTPFHTEFVLAHTDERTRDEVRLLKQFMKGIGVYGAEIKVQGFSGYVAELLVIAHSSFEETLRAASSWRHPVVVDKLVKPLREFSEPLVIPDPTDPLRNAASAVHEEPGHVRFSLHILPQVSLTRVLLPIRSLRGRDQGRLDPIQSGFGAPSSTGSAVGADKTFLQEGCFPIEAGRIWGH